MTDMAEQFTSLVREDGTVARETILGIEEAMLADAVPNCQALDHSEVCPVKHHFSKGIYAREMFIPAGVVIIGKIHKHRHLSIISRGVVSVLTEEGVKKLTGPITFESFPGAKRVVYCHEDTTWTTLHLTEETEIDKLEDDIIAKTYEDFDSYVKQIGDDI